MPSNEPRHGYLPLKGAILARTTPRGFDRDRDAEWKQRKDDDRFWKAVCMAIWRGDNLPAGQAKPVRPLVLTP